MTRCCDWSSMTAESGSRAADAGGATRHAKPRELARRQKEVGVRHRGPCVNGPARAIERVVDEIEGSLADEVVFVAEAEQDLVGERTTDAGAFAGKGQIVGFAHVEVEIERIERDERSQQRGWADGGAAAGNKASDRNLACADTAGEGRGDAQYSRSSSASRMRALASSTAAFEASWSDVRWSTVSWVANSLRRSDCARDSWVFANSTRAFAVCNGRLGLLELDLIGTRIDDEKKVSLVDDLTVLEVDFRQRSADLRA